MEIEHNDITERMIGSFFRASSMLTRGKVTTQPMNYNPNNRFNALISP